MTIKMVAKAMTILTRARAMTLSLTTRAIRPSKGAQVMTSSSQLGATVTLLILARLQSTQMK